MTTLKAKSVSLYLEGLMILTFDKKAKLLEAAPLSRAGHSLAGVIHRRQLGGTPGAWVRESYDPFARSDIQGFATGRIFLETAGAEPKAAAALSGSKTTRAGEHWRPFDGIPNLEKEFFGRKVTLNHNRLKPSLRISNGTFFSVLRPLHPDAPIPVIVESLRVERDALRKLRARTSAPISRDEITRQLGAARKSLDVRPYTAATHLRLTKRQSLVCQLEKNANAGPIEVLRIEYDPNYELRMAVQNFPDLTGHESAEPNDDPIHTFHSLHFYGAIEGSAAERFMLSDEGKQQNYVNRERVGFELETGGGNPCCPIGWMSGTILQ